MKKLLLFLALSLSYGTLYAQTENSARKSYNQTVRGVILDAASRAPLPGAAVLVVGSKPTLGAVTDADGRFRLTNVPLGRQQLKITSLGYEEVTLGEVIVNAGKEVVLDLAMRESITNLDEVAVTYDRSEDRTVANNEMATVSARPFNAAETLRYAGSLGDPSRMAANFAGVSGANDARNDIVVRGNSPASLLWRLEGVNIPNPNHFGALGTSGGPVSMLNTNLLAKSDFLTGAFPAEYANALGSVFDLRLRKGNDEKREFLGQMGFNGLEVGTEGPYSKKSKASYLINYRYSFFGLLKNLGFELAGTPNYQDFTFKTDIPIGKRGKLSAWTLNGASNITFLGKDVDTDQPDAYGDENFNTRVKYATRIGAVSYEHRFSDRTFGKLILSGSFTKQHFNGDTVIYNSDEAKEIVDEIATGQSVFAQQKWSANASVTHKLSAKDKFSAGVITDLLSYDLRDDNLYPVSFAIRDVTGQTLLTQLYAQHKHRFNERLTLNAGLSFLHLALNNTAALEPRAGLSYQVGKSGSLNAAYGLHSTMQPILTYFYRSRTTDGGDGLNNKNLGFTRSHHAVLGYDRMLTPTLRLKLETYHQWLFDAPVDRTPSYFSLLTTGTDFGPTDRGDLVNEGTGRNYGLELTLEKYFSNDYYFLVTASLFESKYKGSDGIERNTPFNNQYVLNLLAGREFRLGKRGNVLSINWKLTNAGGRYVTPIDFAASAERKQQMNDYANAFSSQQTPYFRTDLKIGYKINRRHLTHEIALDLQNITNSQNIFQQAYNPRTNTLGTAYQQGFLPLPFYRLTF